MKKAIFTILSIIAATAAAPASEPPVYLCHEADSHITIDGILDDAEWASARLCSDFSDIRGHDFASPEYGTSIRILRDEAAVYIGAYLEEPYVTASLTGRDDIIYRDNDFEIFLDPAGTGRDYYEIEINAYGTVMDLVMDKPYREGGSYRMDWNCPGLEVKTHIDGTVNDSTDIDRGWSVEVRIPLSAFTFTSPEAMASKVWRANFSRVEWLGRPEENWVWSPTGIVDIHIPDKWGYIRFSPFDICLWGGGMNQLSDDELTRQFGYWRSHGVSTLCWNVGWDREAIARISSFAKAFGMTYHAWIPTVLDGTCDPSWYTVNRMGQSSHDHPAYVSYYHTLDPNNPAVVEHLVRKYSEVADIPTVDFIQLDYVRYADVILARGLWDKYGLVMDEEYPAADYCYCDICVNEFKEKTGIDIRSVEDPSKVKEWAEFRCGAVTELVQEITDAVHAKGKKISADVFPGPDRYAVPMVRQQWDEWNVDAFFPMNYNDFYLEPAYWVGHITAEEMKSIAGKQAGLYSGLFICRRWREKDSIADPEGQGLTPPELEAAVRDVLRSGADGICLFSAGSMTEEHWQVLDSVITDR